MNKYSYYNTEFINIFVNKLQKRGKKLKASKLLKTSLFKLNTNFNRVLFLIETIINTLIIPTKLKKKKKRSLTQYIPVQVPSTKYCYVVISLLLHSLSLRSNYNITDLLFKEFSNILKKEGNSWKLRQQNIVKLQQNIVTYESSFKPLYKTPIIHTVTSNMNLDLFKTVYFIN